MNKSDERKIEDLKELIHQLDYLITTLNDCYLKEYRAICCLKIELENCVSEFDELNNQLESCSDDEENKNNIKSQIKNYLIRGGAQNITWAKYTNEIRGIIWTHYKTYRLKEFLNNSYYRIAVENNYVNRFGEKDKLIENDMNKIMDLVSLFSWRIPGDHKNSFYHRVHSQHVIKAKLAGSNTSSQINLNFASISNSELDRILEKTLDIKTIDLKELRDITESDAKFKIYINKLCSNKSKIQRDHVFTRKNIRGAIETICMTAHELNCENERVDIINSFINELVSHMIIFLISEKEHKKISDEQKKATYHVDWTKPNPFHEVREKMFMPYLKVGIKCFDSMDHYNKIDLNKLINDKPYFDSIFSEQYNSFKIFDRKFVFDEKTKTWNQF
jgi:hypothetical protein